MERPKLALLAVAFCLAGLLSGCGGSSSPTSTSPLSVTTASTLPQGVVNVPYKATLSATGGVAPYAWNVASGNLPSGLSLSRAGVLSGTPTAPGGFSFGVAVSDSEQPPSVANGNFSITIAAALQVTTTSLPNGSPSVFYSATLAASGGLAPYSWTITQGSLPSGLTLNATSGVISGTPTGAGTSTFTVQASDSETPAATATASLSIVINPPPSRNAALYVSTDQFSPAGTGLQIQSDGSLTLLPSSPESAINGSQFGSSPTLPLLFLLTNINLESLLVNPDYSLTSYSSTPLQVNSSYPPPVVDPTGSNLY
jgi:Putative Ig domain